jgi:hypothetical protein
MSTIDAGRPHRGSGPPSAAARPSHAHNLRRVLRFALIRPSGSSARRFTIGVTLLAGSALLASSGAIHLQLWDTGYRTIPTIGPLFLLQGIAGMCLAVLLLLWRRLLVVVAGAGFFLATMGGLLVTVKFGLFGFRDTLAAPFAGLSLVLEGAGALLLIGVGVVLARGQGR